MKGLSTKQAKDNKLKYGDNIIHEAEPENFFDKLKGTLDDPMIKLLLIIAGIMLIMALTGNAEIVEIVGIVLSVAIVSVISARTELASDSEYRKLKANTKKDICKIYRDGKVIEAVVDEVVVGDYIILQSGDKIPADGVLIEGEIGVDNSSLNGEAEECDKIAEKNYSLDDADKEVAITGDTFVDKSSLFRGAVTINGKGIMMVQKVGMKTVMGAMAEDMKDDAIDSPLKVKLADLAGKISKFGYIGAVIIAIALLIQDVLGFSGGASAYFAQGFMPIFKDFLETVMMAVVIIVMAVPEGLPLMIAIVLMQNTSKMLQKNVLVRKPIEIGRAHV